MVAQGQKEIAWTPSSRTSTWVFSTLSLFFLGENLHSNYHYSFSYSVRKTEQCDLMLWFKTFPPFSDELQVNVNVLAEQYWQITSKRFRHPLSLCVICSGISLLWRVAAALFCPCWSVVIQKKMLKDESKNINTKKCLWIFLICTIDTLQFGKQIRSLTHYMLFAYLYQEHILVLS